MTQYLKYFSFCLVVALGFTSCETDEESLDDLHRDLGGYATLTDRSISIFDTNADLNINFFTAEGVTAETVEIIQDGEVIESVNASGENASFNSSVLGDFYETNDDGELEQVSSFPIRIRTTYSNGNISEAPFTVALNRALSLDSDNPTETTMDSIASDTLRYSVSTHSAVVDNVTLELRRNADGTYTDSGLDLSTEEGEIALSDTNYEELNLQVNDTLYYRFTAMSGELSDQVESYIAITPKQFQISNSVTLSDNPAMNQLNLATGEILAEGQEGGEIRFLDPRGFEVVEGADLDFVAVDNDFYGNADVLSARAAYEEGNPVTSATNLENGDVFVYRVTREVEDEDGNLETITHHGVFRVGSFTVVDGTAVSYNIDYAEGR